MDSDEVARLVDDLLRVPQVAGLLVGHAGVYGSEVGADTGLGEPLAEVLDLVSDRLGASGVVGIVGEDFAPFLHSRAASGRVDDYRFGVDLFKRPDVGAGQIAGGLAVAVVEAQRAAADLVFWQDDLTAGAGQDAQRGFVDLRERDAHDASRQEGDPMTRLALGGYTLYRAGVDEPIRDHRRKGFGVGHAAGQEL